MKHTILISILLFTTSFILAQSPLVDIEGDTKIVGKIDIIKAVGDSSVFIGANAGMNDDGTNNNTFVGANAGMGNTSGRGNSFFGRDAGMSNTTGDDNSFFGLFAGDNNTTGDDNSFFGRRAGDDNTTGDNNSFFGREAGAFNTTGDNNSFFGNYSGEGNTTGDDNSFFGRNAGADNNNTRSTMLGYSTRTMDSLDRAIAIGHRAKVSCHNCAVIGGTGEDAVKVGIGTTMPTSELHIEGDTKIVGKIDIRDTVGSTSIFIGINAGLNDDGQNKNTFVGALAGNNNTSGSLNSFFGVEAGRSNTTGGSNSFFGLQAGRNNTTGGSNSFFGIAAGQDHNNTRSTMLGYEAETTDSLDRAIAIGYKAEVSCHNCAVIGGTGVDAVKVGIGTTTPFALLDVKGVSAPGSVGLQILDNAIGISVSSASAGISSTAPLAGSFNGNLNYTGLLNGVSDMRLKTVLKSEDANMLRRINKIALHSYVFKTDQYKHLNLPSQKQYGVMAQELQKIFPDLVSEIEVPMTDDQGNVQEERFEYLGVNHVGMIPILTKGIQELAAENERLKVENESMKAESQSMKSESQSIREENKMIKNRLARLEALILEKK